MITTTGLLSAFKPSYLPPIPLDQAGVCLPEVWLVGPGYKVKLHPATIPEP
jgi:hypothetical protein